MRNLRTVNVFYFFLFLIICYSSNDILPANFLFIPLTHLSSVFDLFDFQEVIHFIFISRVS